LKIGDRRAKGATFISSESSHYSNSCFPSLGLKTNRQRSVGFSRFSFQRASSRGGLINLGHSDPSVKHFSVPDRRPNASPSEMGSATIRKPRITVNPQVGVFSSPVARELETGCSDHEKSAVNGEKKRWGKSSKARKACLGWNSRQDGGRLVERS
jgi:hypothetical protein